jgi:site-specific DNA-methyltransferase (adenine-specific)
MARKPIKLSIAKNAQKWGTGALNIDAARIAYDGPTDKPVPHGGKARQHKDTPGWMADNTGYGIIENPEINPIGRFPSNVLGDIPDYQKYFYCPKVSRRERHIGFDDPGAMFPGSRFDVYMPTAGKTNPETTIEAVEEKLKDKGNNHPTVKPIELMKYLIKLITPPGGTVLDPFNGSGSTGCAAVELGYNYIGCELDPAYVEIANKRIAAWLKQSDPLTASGLFE